MTWGRSVRRRRGVAALVFATIAGCTTAPSTPSATSSRPVSITVLHTNDQHGHFWPSFDGEYGQAARKTVVDRVRAEVASQGGYVLLLDAGDVNSGVPESDAQGAEPDFRGMSAIGYDAMAIGNHEFDRPPATQDRQRFEWSSFPWLSANVYRDGRRLFEPSRIFELGGAKVAVLGLTTEDTVRMDVAGRYPEVAFRSAIDEATDDVPALRRRADMTILLTHLGHYVDGAHGVSAPGDVELARTVPGIDLIVGGHTHTLVCMASPNVRIEDDLAGRPCVPDRQNGAWIVQAGDWGRYVGRADFVVRPGIDATLVRYALLPVNLRGTASVPEDASLRRQLETFEAKASGRASVVVGRAQGRFDGSRGAVRNRPTALGTLITTAMLERTAADLALVSSGGIRDSLPDGPITHRDIVKVQPFGAEIVVVPLRGDELAAYLSTAVGMTAGSGAYAQVSGVRRVDAPSAPGTAGFLVAGEALDPRRTYRLALNAFVAKGGDGYPVLASHDGFERTGLTDAAVLEDYIAAHGVVDPRRFEPAPDGWPRAGSSP